MVIAISRVEGKEERKLPSHSQLFNPSWPRRRSSSRQAMKRGCILMDHKALWSIGDRLDRSLVVHSFAGSGYNRNSLKQRACSPSVPHTRSQLPNQQLVPGRRDRRSPETAGMTDSNGQNASVPQHSISARRRSRHKHASHASLVFSLYFTPPPPSVCPGVAAHDVGCRRPWPCAFPRAIQEGMLGPAPPAWTKALPLLVLARPHRAQQEPSPRPLRFGFVCKY